MPTWFTKLSLGLKIGIGIAILIFAVMIFDFLTGGISRLRSWAYHNNEQATIKKVNDLQIEIDALKKERDDLENKAIEKEAEFALIKGRVDNNTAKQQLEDQKLEVVLEEFSRETIITNNDVDAFTRCNRVKSKLIEQNIPSAKNINCDQYSR